MDIHFVCSHCGRRLSVDSEGAGLKVHCPDCGKNVTVPTRSNAPEPTIQITPPPQVTKPALSSPTPSIAPTPGPRSTGITYGQATAIIVILIVGLFVFPFFRSAFNQVAPPPQWEYVIASVPDHSFDRKMNEYGAEGWELVFARRASDGGAYSPTFSYEMIFKRPKRL